MTTAFDPEPLRRLRRRATHAERVLWHLLRDRRVEGVKFRRQHSVGPFVVDFVALDIGLVIEADGSTHVGRERSDSRRDAYLHSRGLRVLRFAGFQVGSNPGAVLAEIAWNILDLRMTRVDWRRTEIRLDTQD